MKTVTKENIEEWSGFHVPKGKSLPLIQPLWATWICLVKNHDWRVHRTWKIPSKAAIACDRCYQSTHITGIYNVDEKVQLEELRIGWGDLGFSMFFIVIGAVSCMAIFMTILT